VTRAEVEGSKKRAGEDPSNWGTSRPAAASACQNISLYEPEQSLSLSQDEGEQC